MTRGEALLGADEAENPLLGGLARDREQHRERAGVVVGARRSKPRRMSCGFVLI